MGSTARGGAGLRDLVGSAAQGGAGVSELVGSAAQGGAGVEELVAAGHGSAARAGAGVRELVSRGVAREPVGAALELDLRRLSSYRDGTSAGDAPAPAQVRAAAPSPAEAFAPTHHPAGAAGPTPLLDGSAALSPFLTPASVPLPAAASREWRDRRGGGIAGLLADLVHSGEPVLAVAAHAPHRARVLGERVGGFALASYAALEDDPALAAGFTHVVAIDPPTSPILGALPGAGWTHLAWGEPELRFAERILEWDYALRDPLAAVYRSLRHGGGAPAEACEELLCGGCTPRRSPALAGRLVRVLAELALVEVRRDGPALQLVDAPARTDLERSPAFRAYAARLQAGRRWLSATRPTANVAA